MSLDYIRQYYGVPAYKDVRVRLSYSKVTFEGVIVGADGPHLRVRFDGERHAKPVHATWQLTYLIEQREVQL